MSTFSTAESALKEMGRRFFEREMAKSPAEVRADKRERKRLNEKVTITRWQLESYERDSLHLGVWRVWRQEPNYNRHGELLNHPTNDTRKLCHVVSGGGDVCECGKR